MRIRNQISLLTAPVVEARLQKQHLRWLTNITQPQTGTLPLGKKIAILVIFQPKGVARSLFFTCKHLKNAGYSPFVISNAPLNHTDRTKLLACSALLLERPNFGYDFGAYQDGIRLLERIVHNPDRLILMNDSTWFPIRDEDDTLTRMEASEVDMIGHIFKIEDDHRREHDHVESHLLIFSNLALNHFAFTSFWRAYLMSNHRDRTIEFGEKGLTAAMQKASLSFGGLLSRARVIVALSKLNSEQLADTLGQLVMHLAKPRARLEELLAQQPYDELWREAVLKMCTDLLTGRQHLVSTTFVEPAMRLGGMGFVKKDTDLRHHLARIKVLEAVDAGRIAPLQDDVAHEMRRVVDNWVEPFDWRRTPTTRK